jgi:hypothetical protein
MHRPSRIWLLSLVVLLAGCPIFPAPAPPVPLDKSAAAALAKCQSAILKAQAAFVKVKLGAVGSCVDGIMKVRLPFENGLTTAADFDAGIAKMRGKCTKSYAKVGAASTKLVDTILKACTPAESAVIGGYDALRVHSAYTFFGPDPTSILEFAAVLCTLTDEHADGELFVAAPRLMELLSYLGPEYVHLFDPGNGLPNVPLDARCVPLSNAPIPIPTATPTGP